MTKTRTTTTTNSNRKIEWFKMERERLTFEKSGERIMQRAFARMLREFEEKCKENGHCKPEHVDILDDTHIRIAFVQLYIMVGKHFSRRVLRSSIKQDVGTIITQYVLTNVGDRIAGITRTIKQKLRNTVNDVLTGEAINAPREIRRAFKTISTQRAKTIARTEIVSASNVGSLIGAAQVESQFAVEMRKVWLATQDGRTRDAHAIADGQIKKLKDQFVVDGELLEFPGDPKGSPGNVINCRCTLTYEVN